jgi:NADP-dependent 3-hydroxy acid dehydrogenase YdfG
LERGEAAAAAIKQTVPDARLEVLQLDLSSMTSIRAFVKNLSLKDQKIDVLVNNAGVMMIPKRETTADNFEMQCVAPYTCPIMINPFIHQL